MKDRIVIANASGFWGDEADAIRRQVMGGPIDYLTMDYLAEITMIILARQRAKREDMGYARDFVTYLAPLLGEIAARGIRVIANAGGVNPGACGRAMVDAVQAAGLDLPVAVVDGDDLMPRLSDLVDSGFDLPHIETGEPIGDRLDRVNSAHAYLGAQPIVAALEAGAHIVITGRTYDAASVVAPMVHEFGWSWQDYDRLASGLLAGHLIECGAQATGGNFTGWRDVPSFEEIGFPLVEVEPDGAFTLTKHPGSGGLVSRRTAIEQMLYEIGDPRVYASPDVVADFTSFLCQDDGPDRVRFHGARGQAPSDTLKVSVTYESGYRAIAMVVVSGPEAVDKARKFAEIFWSRLDCTFEETRTEFVGHSGCWGESGAPPVQPNEVILRLAAHASDPASLVTFGRTVAGIALAGPPGICGAGRAPTGLASIWFLAGIDPAQPADRSNVYRRSRRDVSLRRSEFRHGHPVHSGRTSANLAAPIPPRILKSRWAAWRTPGRATKVTSAMLVWLRSGLTCILSCCAKSLRSVLPRCSPRTSTVRSRVIDSTTWRP